MLWPTDKNAMLMTAKPTLICSFSRIEDLALLRKNVGVAYFLQERGGAQRKRHDVYAARLLAALPCKSKRGVSVKQQLSKWSKISRNVSLLCQFQHKRN